jgi:triacylglycerol lipase
MRHASAVAVGLLVGFCACMDEAPVPDSSTSLELVQTQTRYPIVLLPGLYGFDTILGVIEYFPGIAEALAAGGGDVYLASGSKTNSSEVRARQIIPQLEEIRAITGAERVNLIGHSQGGLDARVVAALRPDLVASVTTVGSPHGGAAVADLIVSGALGPIPDLLLGGLADLLALLSGSSDPNDVRAAMYALSTAGTTELSERYPAGKPATRCGQGAGVVGGIAYYSWTGVGTMTNPLDILDAAFFLAGALGSERNDGLVGRCSAHWGTVLRDDYVQNHLDQTNMLFSLVSPFGARPTSIFRAHATRLANAGL